SARICSRTRSSSGPVSTESSSLRASASGRPSTTSSATPARSAFGSRVTKIKPTDSATRRRATNASACTEAWSNHCTSSTRHTSRQAPHRPSLGHLRQQAQDGQADQKTVRRRSRAEAERGLQRLTLRNRQALEPVQHRRADLMQPSEGEFHLRLDACGVYHPENRPPPGHTIQHRRPYAPRHAPHPQSPP